MTKAIKEKVMEYLSGRIESEEFMIEQFSIFPVDVEIHNYGSHLIRTMRDDIKKIIEEELKKLAEANKK